RESHSAAVQTAENPEMSSSRRTWLRPVRSWRGWRGPWAPRRLPRHLLLAQGVFPPSSQHSPLHHREEVGGADDTVSLERSDDSAGARDDIEADLRPENSPIEGLAAQGDTGH